jgi:hypothetical protein
LADLHEGLGAGDNEKKNHDNEKGKNVEVVEAPKISDPCQPRRGKLGSSGRIELLPEGQHLVLPEAEVGPSDLVSLKFSLLNELMELRVLNLEEGLDLFG